MHARLGACVHLELCGKDEEIVRATCRIRRIVRRGKRLHRRLRQLDARAVRSRRLGDLLDEIAQVGAVLALVCEEQ